MAFLNGIFVAQKDFLKAKYKLSCVKKDQNRVGNQFCQLFIAVEASEEVLSYFSFWRRALGVFWGCCLVICPPDGFIKLFKH